MVRPLLLRKQSYDSWKRFCIHVDFVVASIIFLISNNNLVITLKLNSVIIFDDIRQSYIFIPLFAHIMTLAHHHSLFVRFQIYSSISHIFRHLVVYLLLTPFFWYLMTFFRKRWQWYCKQHFWIFDNNLFIILILTCVMKFHLYVGPTFPIPIFVLITVLPLHHSLLARLDKYGLCYHTSHYVVKSWPLKRLLWYLITILLSLWYRYC